MRRLLIAVTSVCMVASALVGANLAQANSVWVQSYERASETDTCDSPPESLSEWRATWADPYDPISGPTWHPTWEQWANDGNGGWTCTRSVTWARSSSSGSGSSGATYQLGDIGPGGGLVFLIASGVTYEMAPKTWSLTLDDSEDIDVPWCSNFTSDISGATSTAVGAGSVNTSAMVAVGACTSGAGNFARAYRGGGYDDWFLPSADELNAMCNYSRNPDSPAAPGAACPVGQNPGFGGGAYGFFDDDMSIPFYWSSTQFNNVRARALRFSDGIEGTTEKFAAYRVRPIRAF